MSGLALEIDFCPRWVLHRLGVPCEAQHHTGLLLSNMIALIAPLLLIRLPHICLMQWFLHIPCPGCGVLHAMTSLLRLNFVQAWHFNPAGIPLTCMLCFQIVARPLAIISTRLRLVINQLSRQGSRAVLTSLILVWILRLF